MSQPLTVKIPIKDRDGRTVGEREYATFAGLLAKAHEEGLKRVSTKLVQIPHPENADVAVVTAEVETSRGTFTGVGDAAPNNVNRRIAVHILRMAETRAITRAFRLAVNIGLVSLEELAEMGDDAGDETAPSNGAGPLASHVKRVVERIADRSKANGPVVGMRVPSPNGNGAEPMSLPQRRLLYRMLSERGHDNDAATARLRALAGVESTTQITKSIASRVIEALQREPSPPTNGAGH